MSPTASTCRRHYRVRHRGGCSRFRRPVPGRGTVQTSTGATHRRRISCCAPPAACRRVNRPDLPGIATSPARCTTPRPGRTREPDFAWQARRAGRHRFLGYPGGTAHRRAGRNPLTVFQRSPNYSVPMPNRPWSTEDDVQRIKEEYPERRDSSAYAPGRHAARHPITRPPRTPVPKNGRRRCGSGGRRAACCSARPSPTRTDRSRRQRHRAGVRRGTHPGARRRSRCRRGPDPGRPSDRHQAHLHRHRLLRDVQPRRRDAWSTCAASPSTADHRRRSSHRRRPTYPCDVLVFATGFDAMTGALTRIDPVGSGGARLSDAVGRRTRHLPRADGPTAAEPVQLQRTGQPVGAGQHGAARRGSGRLGRSR